MVGVGWQGDHSSRPQTREEVETGTCPSALARENCHGFEMRAEGSLQALVYGWGYVVYPDVGMDAVHFLAWSL